MRRYSKNTMSEELVPSAGATTNNSDKEQSLNATSDGRPEKVKRTRAQGGCLGTKGR